MFIVGFSDQNNSSIGAKCALILMSSHCAPTELLAAARNEVYKHSVPTGLRKIAFESDWIYTKLVGDISFAVLPIPPKELCTSEVPESKTKSEPTPEPEATREPREPRVLSTEYHKARKQLMLWAGILFIWELVGIDLEKAKEAGGNFGAIIGAIKSPQAVPWVLLILVGYFVFKLRIEWRQSNEARRKVREAKQDYYSACIVALAACIFYFGQTISRVQFADLIQSPKGWSLSVGGLIGAVFAVMALGLLGKFKRRDPYFFYVFPLLLLVLAELGFQQRERHNWTFELIGVGSGALLIVVAFFVARKAVARFGPIHHSQDKEVDVGKTD